MANKIKGEFKLPNDMIMVYDYRAMVEFEDATEKNAFDAVLTIMMGKAKAKEVVAFYHACLTRHQPEMTFDEAADIASDYPHAFVETLKLAMPQMFEPAKESVGNDQSPVKKSRKPTKTSGNSI